MARIESAILVPISVEDAFSFLNTRESHLKFIPRITAFDQTSPGTFGQVGTTVAGMLNYFGIRIPVEYEIIEVEPSRRLAMKGQMGPVAFTDGYMISKNGAGTEVKFWLELKPTGWTRIFTPFAGLVGKLHAWETLRNLKRAIETSEVLETSQV